MAINKKTLQQEHPVTLRLPTFILVFFSCIAFQAIGQQDTIYDPIRVIYSDKFIAVNSGESSTQSYTGSVKIVHDTTYFFCDSAITSEAFLRAFGDVTILKSDTINTFSDRLYYNAKSSRARLSGNVILINGEEQLFTDTLVYNLSEDIASYQDTALMLSGTSKLSSLRGNYNMNLKIAKFYVQVTLIDSSFTLLTDTLIYDLASSKARYYGPSYIEQEDAKIYAEEGYYNTETQDAFFEKNAKYTSSTGVATADRMLYVPKEKKIILDGNASVKDSTYFAQADIIEYYRQDSIITLNGNAYFEDDQGIAQGDIITLYQKTDLIEIFGNGRYTSENNSLASDTLIYNSATEVGKTLGNAVYEDTLNSRKLYADRLIYNADGTYRAYNLSGRPYLEQINAFDTTYLSADTLFSRKVTTDSLGLDTSEIFIGYPNVKVYSNGFQAVSDSLAYAMQDSSLTLFGNPYAWADTSQFNADTIVMKTVDEGVRNVDLYGKANIINYLDSVYQDQIKGKVIHALLDSQQMESMKVIGNAETIYFLRDEIGLYIAANKTICSYIDFIFESGELKDIKFHTDPVSKMVPIAQAQQSDVKLTNIKWDESHRPMEKDDIFVVSDRSILVEEETDILEVKEESDALDDFEKATREVLNKQKDKKGKSKGRE